MHEKYHLIEFFENIAYLPEWMADAEYCNSCTITDEPRSSLKALHELCTLLKTGVDI
jgi:hypothetical protein